MIDVKSESASAGKQQDEGDPAGNQVRASLQHETAQLPERGAHSAEAANGLYLAQLLPKFALDNVRAGIGLQGHAFEDLALAFLDGLQLHV